MQKGDGGINDYISILSNISKDALIKGDEHDALALCPGVGTIDGFVIGVAIGAIVDFVINVDWTGDGLSLMDTIKGGIYSLMCPAKG